MRETLGVVLLAVVLFLTAGTTDWPMGWALVVAVLGYAFGVWAMAVNAYFSQIVRIQQERGHTVVTDGPYRFVRHPGYVGVILFELAVPVMLGSLWALAVGGLIALLIVIRTALEDRTLQAELDGYPEYARRVKYRLLPAVWQLWIDLISLPTSPFSALASLS